MTAKFFDPVSFKEPFRLLAIDPGSSCLGLSYITSTLKDRNDIQIKKAFTKQFSGNNYPHELLQYGAKTARLLEVYDTIKTTIEDFKPHHLVVEGNYLGRFANAFEVLVEVTFVIRNAWQSENRLIPMGIIATKTAKSVIGYDSVNRKIKEPKLKVDIALRKYLAEGNFSLDSSFTLDDLDEHSKDAIVVGIGYLKTCLLSEE